MEPLSAKALEEKWQNAAWRGRLRDSSNPYDNLNLRLRRSLSWLRRAEEEYYKTPAKAPDSDAADRKPDFDAAFIFYWIAFNAVYELREEPHSPAKTRFAEYFSKTIESDTDEATRSVVQSDLASEIEFLLENKYVSDQYWNRRHGLTESENWKRDFRTKQRKVASAIKQLSQTSIAATEKARDVLCNLFDRLYTLRNQLLHGGATWNSSMNRHQVEPGARIMSCLVPHFIDVMIEHPDAGWGAPCYPPVREKGPLSGFPGDE